MKSFLEPESPSAALLRCHSPPVVDLTLVPLTPVMPWGGGGGEDILQPLAPLPLLFHQILTLLLLQRPLLCRPLERLS